MIMKRISILFLGIFLCGTVYAQDKGNIEMNVPDSLLHFDYHFDYSVFDSPYRGAYEFSPYNVKINPTKSGFDGKKLYLSAGAGFTMHPELDFYWTPLRKDNCSLSLYNFGKGYMGPYSFVPDGGSSFSGYDFSDELGLDARWVNKKSYVSLQGGWDGVFSSADSWKSTYNSFFASFGVKARNDNPSFFYYDFKLDYRHSSDNLSGSDKIGDNYFSLGGSIGPVIKRNFRLLIDFRVDYEKLSDSRDGMTGASAFLASGTPHLKFDLGPFNIDAGAVFDYSQAGSGLFSLSPSVKASVNLAKDQLKLYAGFVGGQKIHSYNSLKSDNHFHVRYDDSPSVSWTRYDAFAGFKGTIGQNFEYDLKGGYKVEDNAAVAYVSYVFADVSYLYFDAFLAWHSESLDIDGKFRFVPKFKLEEGSYGFTLPLAQGDFRAVYNWNKRVYAGVTLQFVTDRSSIDPKFSKLQGYFSPGLYAEFKINRVWGVWAKGGNLLGQAVYDTPGYAVKGPYFTLGISCNL